MGKELGFAGGVLLWGLAASGQTISFQPPSSSLFGQGPLAIATGDFNGDGKIDLVIANGVCSLTGKGRVAFAEYANRMMPW